MSEYEELVELGFEGVDRFATHLHDPFVDRLSRHRPFSHSKKKGDSGSPASHQQEERQRELPKEDIPSPARDPPRTREPLEQQDLPPHPQWQVPPPPFGAPPPGLPYAPIPGGTLPNAIPVVPAVPYPVPQATGKAVRIQDPRQRSYSESRGGQYDSKSVPEDIGELDSDSDVERGSRTMYPPYAADRRGNAWRDDDRYERTVEDREYYGPRGTMQQMVVRTRDANRYGENVPRALSPPDDYGYAQRGYAEEEWGVRGRPSPHRQRSTSWSPPRRRHESRSRRVRSKSPNHHRALAIVVGALVGGVAGSRVKKNDAVPNTVATVGGAILGGIAGREVEQEYDRHKERRAHEAYERGEAREKRRLEREYKYG